MTHHATITSLNPATGAVIWTGQATTVSEADGLIHNARKAFSAWSQTPLAERQDVLAAFAALMTDRKEELARAISQETGKPLWDAHGEAASVVAKVGISLQAHDERTGVKTTQAGGAALSIQHRPHGVMAVLGPFNFPAHLPNGHIVPALLAGNAVMFKPSEHTPMTGALLASWWQEAGLPDGVLHVVQGGADLARHLVRHDGVNGILFTGGVQAGLAIHRQLAGRPEKILALELGGNNPLIVWDVADIRAAARMIVQSAYISSGQRCTCARRLIVRDDAQGAKIIAAVRALAAQLIIGPPDQNREPFMGPLISPQAAESVLAAQCALSRLGAIALLPSRRLKQGPAFLSPGLWDVTEVSDRKDEEVFGPLLQVIRVRDLEAAIAEANATRFGLAAGVLSDDEAIFNAVAPRLRAGIINWNRPITGASSAAPFGGVGLSGNHRPAGYYAADYSAWPVATLAAPGPLDETDHLHGIADRPRTDRGVAR